MCEEGYHNVSAIDIAKYDWYLQVLFTNILMISLLGAFVIMQIRLCFQYK